MLREDKTTRFKYKGYTIKVVVKDGKRHTDVITPTGEHARDANSIAHAKRIISNRVHGSDSYAIR